MKIVTTNTVAGKSISQDLGVISASAVLGFNVVRDVKSIFTDFFGGRSGTYEARMETGIQELLKDLEEKAKPLRVDAIVGLRIHSVPVGRGGMTAIVAYGTAVRLGD